MSNLLEHAEREFKALGWPGDCEMQQQICENIKQLLEVFSNQGHSGSTAPYCLQYFTELAKFNPIAPLTGKDDEWVEVGGDTFQNKRDSEVFKEGKDGAAYWISGKIFRDKDGCTYTSGESLVSVVFPWKKPKPDIIEKSSD